MSFLKIPNVDTLIINAKKITRHFAKYEDDKTSIYIIMSNGKEINIDFPTKTEMFEFDDLIRKKKFFDITKQSVNVGVSLISTNDIVICEKEVDGITIYHQYKQFIPMTTTLAKITEWQFLLDDLEVQSFPWGKDIVPDIQPDFINPSPFEFIMKNIKKIFTKRS